MEIPDELFGYYEEAVDALLTSPYTSKEALLYYEKRTVNSDQGLGGSDGVSENILIDTIRVRQYNKEKNWAATAGLQIVDGRCQIIGYSSNKASLKKCTFIEIDGQNFKLASEPMRHGFGNRYFSAYLDLLE